MSSRKHLTFQSKKPIVTDISPFMTELLIDEEDQENSGGRIGAFNQNQIERSILPEQAFKEEASTGAESDEFDISDAEWDDEDIIADEIMETEYASEDDDDDEMVSEGKCCEQCRARQKEAEYEYFYEDLEDEDLESEYDDEHEFFSETDVDHLDEEQDWDDEDEYEENESLEYDEWESEFEEDELEDLIEDPEEYYEELDDEFWEAEIPAEALEQEIHNDTFTRVRNQRNGFRRDWEIEAAMQLHCDDQTPLDYKALYELLSGTGRNRREDCNDNDWDAFRDMRRCASCAAFTSGFGWRRMTWDKDSHAIREQFPYVWLTVEPRRYRRREQRLNRRVDFATDMMDDFYFDDDHFTLFCNKYLLRGRKRWDSWRCNEAPDIRRLLVATKRIEGVDPDGIKKAYKEDIRLNRVRRRHLRDLVRDIQKGLVDWSRSRRARQRNFRAIFPIRRMYETLQRRGVFSGFTKGNNTHVLDLKPKVFIRSLRSRYHLRETSLRRLEEIRLLGIRRLRTLRNNARMRLRDNTLNPALQNVAQNFVRKATGCLNYSLVTSRAQSQLQALRSGRQITRNRVRALRPRRRPRIRRHRELQERRVIAETLNKLYHELAMEANNSGLLNSISGVSTNGGQFWVRQIEAAGSAGLGLWFDQAREHYVPRSGRIVRDDFLIDTLDASGMFTPDAWACISEDQQTHQAQPDINKLFYASLTNEVQIEQGRERAFLRTIDNLKDQIARTSNSGRRQRLQTRLTGANFVFGEYRKALIMIAKIKENQILNGIDREVSAARRAGESAPQCQNWAWKPAKQGKGEKAMTLLRQKFGIQCKSGAAATTSTFV
ncbi:MAG: hypothetical protein ACE5HS_09330 [bacterium]